jgi:hypothetical protein
MDDWASYTTTVWLVPVTGGEARQLVNLSKETSILNAQSQMSWTPDGRGLLTARKSGSATELWLIDIETGRGRKLNVDTSEWLLGEGGPPGGFAVSPDGQAITFLMGRSAAEVWALENFQPRSSAK